MDSVLSVCWCVHYLQPENEDDDRRNWRFKCDTLDEMNQWVESFTNALRVR